MPELGVQPPCGLGDVVVACHGDTAILSTADFPYEASLVGLHGSLTPDEMHVPFLAARGRAAMVRRTVEPGESALIGQHGSLTDAERRVPLLLAHG